MSLNNDSKQPPKGARPTAKKRRTHKAPAKRIMISLPEGLIAKIDEAAGQDYTSRSDIIRMAILWYLRPQGRDFDQTDPEQIIKTLQHRQARVAVRQMLDNIKNNE